jgi:hypothetical protein
MGVILSGVLVALGTAGLWMGLNWHVPATKASSWRDGGNRPLPPYVRSPDAGFRPGDTLTLLPVNGLTLRHRAQFRRLYRKELAALPPGAAGERILFSRLVCEGFRTQTRHATRVCVADLSLSENDLRDTLLPLPPRQRDDTVSWTRLVFPDTALLGRIPGKGRVLLVSDVKLWIQVASEDSERLFFTGGYTVYDPETKRITAYGRLDAYRGYALKPSRGKVGEEADTTSTRALFGAFGRDWIYGHLFRHIAAQVALETPFSSTQENRDMLGIWWKKGP